MVVKPRLLLVVATALTLVATAAVPAAAVYEEAEPSPLRQGSLLRVKDMAANGATSGGAVVAVGWREGSSPAQLLLAFSTNGGKDYLRTNGRLRKYPILGDAKLGISLAVCDGRVWAATAFNNTGDAPGDRDVLLTSRTVGGGAAQAFLTDTSGTRLVRDVQVACVGNQFLAVAWLEKSGGKFTAKLLLRSMEPLGQAPDFETVIGLGEARFKDGIALAASQGWAQVAWVRGNAQNLRIRRVNIEPGDPPSLSPEQPTIIASGDILDPQLAAKGRRFLLAYTDAGRVKARLSSNLGETYARPKVLARGTMTAPSELHSVDVVGNRLVVEATRNQKGTLTPQRIQSTNGGSSWGARSFGHKGARVGALLKKKGSPALLMEAWHNNAASDTLRAQFERP